MYNNTVIIIHNNLLRHVDITLLRHECVIYCLKTYYERCTQKLIRAIYAYARARIVSTYTVRDIILCWSNDVYKYLISHSLYPTITLML